MSVERLERQLSELMDVVADLQARLNRLEQIARRESPLPREGSRDAKKEIRKIRC